MNKIITSELDAKIKWPIFLAIFWKENYFFAKYAILGDLIKYAKPKRYSEFTFLLNLTFVT